jgi:hypothetical protein
LARKAFGGKAFGRFLQQLVHERRLVTPAMMGRPAAVLAAYGLELFTAAALQTALRPCQTCDCLAPFASTAA